MWTVWIFDSFAIYRCWAFIWQNCFTKYGQALECHNWYVWKPWIWLTRSLWNKQQCQNGIAQIAIKKCSSKVNGFSVIGVLSVAYPLDTLTCIWSFVSIANRAFQWVSHNALFCKSQTHSDNDSIILFWLSISGNSDEKLKCGNVVNMPYCCQNHNILANLQSCKTWKYRKSNFLYFFVNKHRMYPIDTSSLQSQWYKADTHVIANDCENKTNAPPDMSFKRSASLQFRNIK